MDLPGYQLQGELGRGGMGVVYRAVLARTGRPVAVKMILPGKDEGEKELARFRVEMDAVSRLDHPNVVRVVDVGEHDGRPFFAMEFLDGGTLKSRLEGGPLPVPAAARLVHGAALGVAHAHEKGIIHRDLKPANILLARDGTPKVSDFGLAKRLDADGGLTGTGDVFGTVSYMSPEQAEGLSRHAGPPADVWALGAVLYECLTGRVPFPGANQFATLGMILKIDPDPPSKVRNGIAPELEAVVLRSLAKPAADRYPTAGAFAAALAPFAGPPDDLTRTEPPRTASRTPRSRDEWWRV